jgi:hypothetical protein
MVRKDPKHDTGAVAVTDGALPVHAAVTRRTTTTMSRWNCRCRRCCCCSAEEYWSFLGGASTLYDDDDRPSWRLGPERERLPERVFVGIDPSQRVVRGRCRMGRPSDAGGQKHFNVVGRKKRKQRGKYKPNFYSLLLYEDRPCCGHGRACNLGSQSGQMNPHDRWWIMDETCGVRKKCTPSSNLRRKHRRKRRRKRRYSTKKGSGGETHGAKWQHFHRAVLFLRQLPAARARLSLSLSLSL